MHKLSFIKVLKHYFHGYPKSNNRSFSILIFAGFFLPFIVSYHVGPIPSFFNEVVAVGASSLLLIGLKPSSTGTWRFPLAAWGPLALGLCLILQASLDAPAYWNQRLLPFLVLCWVSMMIFVFANKDNGGHELSLSAATGLWAAAFVTSLLIFSQILSATFRFHIPAIFVSPGVGFGNVAQVNHAAALCAVGGASGIYLVQQNRITSKIGLTSLAAILWGGAMTGSKGFLVYVIALFCLWVRFGKKQFAVTASFRRLLLIAGCCVATFYLLGYWLNLRGFVGILHPSLAFNARGPAMQHAWHLFKEHPVLGFGWSQFAYGVYLNSQTESLPRMWALGLTFPNHCHNIVFQLLATVGLAGFIAVLLTFFPLRWADLLRRFTPESQWLIGIFLVLLLFSLWEYPLWYAYFLLPISLFLGKTSTTKNIRLHPLLRQTLCLIPFAVIGFLIKFSKDYTKLTLSLEKIGTPMFNEEIVNSLTDLQNESLFSSYVEWFCPGILTPESTSSPEEQIATCERMLKTMPVAEAAYRIPYLYQQMNETGRAKVALKQAYSAFPHDLRDYIDLFKPALSRDPDPGAVMKLQAYPTQKNPAQTPSP
jgi:O-antigen ligase